MPQFSNTSQAKLDTCHLQLRTLFSQVVKGFDCKVLEGQRSLTKQAELYAQGKSKVTKGKHNERPSLAIDVAPYPIDWNDTERFYYFAGYVKGIASCMGIEIRWGGDWDNDTEVSDNSFNDLVHFEIRRRT